MGGWFHRPSIANAGARRRRRARFRSGWLSGIIGGAIQRHDVDNEALTSSASDGGAIKRSREKSAGEAGKGPVEATMRRCRRLMLRARADEWPKNESNTNSRPARMNNSSSRTCENAALRCCCDLRRHAIKRRMTYTRAARVVGPKMAGATMGMRSIGGGGLHRLASVQVGREARRNCSESDIILKVQLMGGAEGPRGVEFDIEPPFHMKLRR